MTIANAGPAKEVWIAPEIKALDVDETANRPTRGNDGQTRYIDCTKS